MKEIKENLFVGNRKDFYEALKDEEFAVLSCSKKQHVEHVFPKTRRLHVPKYDKNYLFKESPMWASMNLVDAESADYFDSDLIEKGLRFVRMHHGVYQEKVLICCEQGMSRSPSIALLYLALTGQIDDKSYFWARKEFEHLYGGYSPNQGVFEHLEKNWMSYRKRADEIMMKDKYKI